MGKGPLSFRRSSSRRRLKNPGEPAPHPTKQSTSSPPPDGGDNNVSAIANAVGEVGSSGAAVGKGKKKVGGARMWPWMRFDRSGRSEVLECEKSAIVRRVSIPTRDLRILGPVFSQSSHILGKIYVFRCDCS